MHQQLEPGADGEPGDYKYRVIIDGTTAVQLVNSEPREWKDMMLYVGDPWHQPLNGHIRNLKITSELLNINTIPRFIK